MEYYAHSRETDGQKEYQTMKEHAEGVARLVKKFAAGWCTPGFAENLGLLHDVGKYRSVFQSRIRGAKITAEHAVYGALESRSCGLADAAAYCIAGHHAGLPDCGTGMSLKGSPELTTRLKYAERDDAMREIAVYKNELRLKPIGAEPPFLQAVQGEGEAAWKEYAFWIRMMFSCLTDADFLDTEAYCDGGAARGLTADFAKCKAILEAHLAGLERSADNPTKAARKTLREQVMSHADEDADLYYMNVPTGGGKTLASMQFALERALRTGKKRIIYIIPYQSIIEQNAAVFRNLFGADVVLEHHSDFDFKECARSEAEEAKLRRTAENWDAPIIVTTNVRFFESIYGNRTSALRKLHNIADSILVFDEAHMLPPDFFQPCLEAVKILTTRYGCEAVFLTATMPNFDRWLSSFKCEGMRTRDLVTDRSCFPAFDRCKIENLGPIDKESLLMRVDKEKNALIVVNYRKTARELYDNYAGKKFHLSTYMTQFDRKRVIDAVKKALADGEKFCLFSTSLIEAGVDLDFAAVYREHAGLEHLLQTAGRCNRNGESADCTAYSFALEGEDGGQKDNEFKAKRYDLSKIFELFPNVGSPEAVRHYFDWLYAFGLANMTRHDFLYAKRSGESDGDCLRRVRRVRLDTVGRKENLTPFYFAKYANDFHLIDKQTSPLVIVTEGNREEIKDILNRLAFGGSRTELRKLQKYTVALRPHEWKTLKEVGVIGESNGVEYLSNERYYNRETGLTFEDDESYYF